MSCAVGLLLFIGLGCRAAVTVPAPVHYWDTTRPNNDGDAFDPPGNRTCPDSGAYTPATLQCSGDCFRFGVLDLTYANIFTGSPIPNNDLFTASIGSIELVDPSSSGGFSISLWTTFHRYNNGVLLKLQTSDRTYNPGTLQYDLYTSHMVQYSFYQIYALHI